MTKSATAKSSGTGRGRAPYATHACNLCRRKKTKCDGTQPVCGSCVASGRPDECSWTAGEPVRVPRTEAHFEALRKRVEILQAQVATLQALVDKCNAQHGGLHGSEFSIHRQTTAPDVSASPADTSSEPSDVTNALENLKLEDNGNLIVYGANAPFRFEESAEPQPATTIDQSWVDPMGTYTFMHQQTTDESAEMSQTVEWHRHLPLNSVALSQEQHDLLLEHTFKFFTSYCLRIVPSLFQRDMYRALATPVTQAAPQTSHYSPMLHNVLVALGTSYSDDLNIRNSGYIFAAAAQQRIEDEALKPNIAAVQGLSLLGSYHSSRGRQNLGFLYFGMSIRMSQILGLHHDVSDWVKAGFIKHEDMLNRNWIQWSIFAMDVNWCQYVGRDPSVTMPSTPPLCPFPAGVGGDKTVHDGGPERYTPHPDDVCRSFPATAQLSVIVRSIVVNINKMATSARPSEQLRSEDFVSKIDIQLNSWKEGLHSDLIITLATKATTTPQKIMLHLLYWTAFMLLHKPFVRPRKQLIYSADKEIDHYKLCKRAADNVMDLMQLWKSRWSIRSFPMTLSTAIFAAGTIYLMEAEHALMGSRVSKTSLRTALSQTSECLEYLRESSISWPSCRKVANILEMLYHRQTQPVLDKRALSLDDIPSVPAKRSPERSPTLSHAPYNPYESNSGSGSGSSPSNSSSSEGYHYAKSESSAYLEGWDASQGAFGPIVAADALLSGQTIFGNAPGLLDHEHHIKPSHDIEQDEMHTEFEIPTMITGSEWAQQDEYHQRQHQHHQHQHHHQQQQQYHHSSEAQALAQQQHRYASHSVADYGLPEPSLLTQMWRQRGPVTWRG